MQTRKTANLKNQPDWLNNGGEAMPKVTFIHADGTRLKIEASVGETVLELAHEYGVDLEGACEGSMACSTCHVIVDEGFFDRLEAPSEDEEDMLDLAFGLSLTSRLGCQIVITDVLDGIVLRVPAGSRNALLG